MDMSISILLPTGNVGRIQAHGQTIDVTVSNCNRIRFEAKDLSLGLLGGSIDRPLLQDDADDRSEIFSMQLGSMSGSVIHSEGEIETKHNDGDQTRIASQSSSTDLDKDGLG